MERVITLEALSSIDFSGKVELFGASSYRHLKCYRCIGENEFLNLFELTLIKNLKCNRPSATKS